MALGRTPTGNAPLNSPAFTGSPTAPTPSPGDNDTSIATTAFVAGELSGVGGGGGATFVVAASDAAAESIASADYVCDGVADQVEINAAITALPGGGIGGLVRLTEGSFYVTAPITANKAGTILAGSGWIWGSGGTFIYRAATADFYALTMSAYQTWLRDLAIYDDASFVNANELVLVTSNAHFFNVGMENDQTSGGAIVVDNSARVWLNQCDIEGEGVVVRLGVGAGSEGITAADTDFFTYTDGHCIEVDVAHTSGFVYLSNCQLSGPGGVNIYGDQYTKAQIRDCFVEGYDTLVALDVDSVGHVLIEGCWVSGDGGLQGIRITDATTTLNNSGPVGLIVGNAVNRCGRNGIELFNCNDFLVQGNRVYGASQDTDDTYSGILIDGNSDRNAVIGNMVRRAGTNHPLYGIRVDDATCNDNFITGNDLLNSAKSGGAGGAYSDAGTGTITTAGNRT